MTFSRLTLGDPRLKSKLRGGSVDISAPCEEPLTTGANIFPYDTFEDVLSQQGAGPEGDEIPYRSGRAVYWPSEYVFPENGPVVAELPGGPTDPYHLVNNSPPGANGHWRISTANPDAGTHHARLVKVSAGTVSSLILFRMAPCPETGGPVQNFRGLGGQIVTIDWRARAVATSGAATPATVISFGFYDQGQNFITSASTDKKLAGTAYNSFQVSIALPSGTWYWVPTFQISWDGEFGESVDEGVWDVDNLTIGLE